MRSISACPAARVQIRPCGLSAVLALGLWFGLQQLPLGVGGRLIVGPIAYMLAFVVLGTMLGLIERDDLRFIWRWLTLRMFKH